MNDEQPNTNNYSTNTGNNHAFAYISSVSYAGANFTLPIRGLSPTAEDVTGMGGESTGMGETDSEGVGDDTDNTDANQTVNLYNQAETLRSCLVCLDYVDEPEFSKLKKRLTLKCLDVIEEVIKGFHKEWMAEEE